MAERKPSEPIPAATVVLLRPGIDGGIEMFMVVRHHQIDFASGALVFPGGKVDAQDSAHELKPFLFGAAADPGLAAMQVASIREAFEESGVLLARPFDAKEMVDADRLKALSPYRQRLHGGELSLAEFAEREQLMLACDQLVHFAHWITPTMMPKRFDTHFFLALAPLDHLAVHDGHESVDSLWINAAQAQTDAASGKYVIIFPTLRNVARIAAFDSPEAVMEQARRDKIVTVQPWTEKRDDGLYICIPKEAGYDVSEELVPQRST